MRIVLATLLACATLAAHAGRSCEVVPPQADSVQRALQLAQAVALRLDQSGAEAVVLARVGQDLGRYGQRYSHMAFAYRESIDGRDVWRVVHKLNQCGTAQSAVYRQGLAEFFLDDLFDYQAAIVVLTPDAQAKLLPVLRDDARLGQMHTATYNMVAYPWSQTYQQSNQWALETFALSQDPSATTRARAQAWLRLRNYEPAVLRLGAFTRLGARMTRANVAFDDHPNEKRFSDRIETVSADSVLVWLQRAGLGAAPITVR